MKKFQQGKKMSFFPLKQGVIGRSEIPGSMYIRNTKALNFFFFYFKHGV